MGSMRTIDDQKIIHQAAVRSQRLGAHPRLSKDEVFLADLGYQPLQAAYKRSLAE